MRLFCSPEARGTRTAGCTVALPASSSDSPTNQMWSASKSEEEDFERLFHVSFVRFKPLSSFDLHNVDS